MSDQAPKQPAKKFRGIRGISVALWKNVTQKKGESVFWYVATPDKRYRDENGIWRSTNGFTVMDLPVLIVLFIMAYVWMVIVHDDDREPMQDFPAVPAEPKMDDREAIESESENESGPGPGPTPI